MLYHITNEINRTIHSEIQIIISHVYSPSPVTLLMLQITPSRCNRVTLFTRDDPINLIKIRGERCSDLVELKWTDSKQCTRLASGQVLKPQFMQSLIHTQSIPLITIWISYVLTWCSHSPFFCHSITVTTVNLVLHCGNLIWWHRSWNLFTTLVYDQLMITFWRWYNIMMIRVCYTLHRYITSLLALLAEI